MNVIEAQGNREDFTSHNSPVIVCKSCPLPLSRIRLGHWFTIYGSLQPSPKALLGKALRLANGLISSLSFWRAYICLSISIKRAFCSAVIIKLLSILFYYNIKIFECQIKKRDEISLVPYNPYIWVELILDKGEHVLILIA